MWLKRSSRPTAAKSRSRVASILLAATACGWVGCGQTDVEPVIPLAPADGFPVFAPGTDVFSVMSYNVGAYAYQDRTGDGQAAEFKPDDECAAVIQIIAGINPDILALQEMGHPEVFTAFQQALQDAGVPAYPFSALLQQEDSDLHLALLSRYPLHDLELHTQQRYSVSGQSVPIKRGFIEADISINPNYRLRLFVVQLKSKDYHPLGHSEMRRSEARLINNQIRRALRSDPQMNILVVGDLNDQYQSAPLRTLTGAQEEYLVDLRLTDRDGALWTAFDPEQESYHRIDFLLASPYMLPEYVSEQSFVLRHPLNAHSGARRPLVAVFQARNRSPVAAPLLPAYEEE